MVVGIDVERVRVRYCRTVSGRKPYWDVRVRKAMQSMTAVVLRCIDCCVVWHVNVEVRRASVPGLVQCAGRACQPPQGLPFLVLTCLGGWRLAVSKLPRACPGRARRGKRTVPKAKAGRWVALFASNLRYVPRKPRPEPAVLAEGVRMSCLFPVFRVRMIVVRVSATA